MRVEMADAEVATNWVGVCREHMASHKAAKRSKYGINHRLKCALNEYFHHSDNRLQPQIKATMGSWENATCAPAILPLQPQPLQCLCPHVVATPSSRTTTGRCYNLYCYIDFGSGIHFTHNLNLQILIPSTLVAHPSAELPVRYATMLQPTAPNSDQNPPPIEESMVRHRMHNRRGGNRGSLSRSRHSPASEIASSLAEQNTGRYHNKCSGRGHFHSGASAVPPSTSALLPEALLQLLSHTLKTLNLSFYLP